MTSFNQIQMSTSKLKILLSIIIIICGFTSCRTSCTSDGFNLQNFEISNHKLDSIVNVFTHEYNKNTKKNSEVKSNNVIVIDLQFIDSIPQFWFSINDEKELREKYIFQQNRRIIGYLTRNNCNIILLSGINSKNEFENIFGQFVFPTKLKKTFDFLYFPDNQYETDSIEVKIKDGKIIKRGIWPITYSMYDYTHIQFDYINNEFVNK